MYEKIFFERPDIKEKVMDFYPITKKERKCAMEKSKNEQKRFDMAKRLYEKK